MEDVRIFVRFLRLAQKNFRNEWSLEFYAGKLELAPKELSRIIWDTSSSTLPEWLDVLKRIDMESHSYHAA